jgi:hypothetical protein
MYLKKKSLEKDGNVNQTGGNKNNTAKIETTREAVFQEYFSH